MSGGIFKETGRTSDILQGALNEGLAKYGVPGASLALYANGTLKTAAAGVLNLATEVPVTDEAMFQIGSITKVMTASLLMQLVDASVLELDRPVVEYMAEFRLADQAAAAQITVRQLLNHSSGIEGDFFFDTGRGDEVLARYVQHCSSLEMIHPPGVAFSYCNTGYAIAGRLLEVLTGKPWDVVLREKLFTPLQMAAAASRPEDLVGQMAAMGHVPGADGLLQPLPSAYAIPFSMGPAGATPTMAASDLVRFALMHLNGGQSATGEQVMQGESVEQMQQAEIKLPGLVSWGKEIWGLGWSLNFNDGRIILCHDGNTMGQRAFLRAAPDSKTVMVLLTNGGAAIDLAHQLIDDLFAPAAGLPVWQKAETIYRFGADYRPYIGRYQHGDGYTDVYLKNDQLWMKTLESPEEETQYFALKQVGEHSFSSQRPPDLSPWYLTFLDFDDAGAAQTLFSLYRRCQRVGKEEL